MKTKLKFSVVTLSVLLLSGCGDNDNDKQNNKQEDLLQVSKSPTHFVNQKILGGATTDVQYSSSTHAFSQPAANLKGDLLDLHMTGDANFETNPNGFGPVFNHTNCNACHQRDGRDSLPVLLGDKEYLSNYITKDKNGWYKLNDEGTFLRISIEDDTKDNNASDCWGAPKPVPNFSDQLFNRGVYGVRDANNTGAGQADVWMKYVYKTVTYPDGTVVKLSKPIFGVDNPYDAPDNPNEYNPITVEENATSRLFRPDVKIGPRIGMPMIGLGLLNAIPEADILALADENDKDGDGISGKPNWVCDKEKYDKCHKAGNCATNPPVSLGRFGWKANTPTVAHQGLGAMRGDIGATNPLFKMESTAGTDLMKKYKKYTKDNGINFTTYCDTNETDVGEDFAKSVVFYSETLSVPPRRDVNDSDVQQGAMEFEKLGCVKCHHPSFTTASEYHSYSMGGGRIHELENQKIYPFTDMLLHDMGPDLADGRADFKATGNEWKTRPLWGIGATQIINPGAGFLHDGRAKTLEEAILWHGGEAQTVRQNFMNLSKTKRDRVIKFLNSL